MDEETKKFFAEEIDKLCDKIAKGFDKKVKETDDLPDRTRVPNRIIAGNG